MVYRGARKGKGLVVAPKDYSLRNRFWWSTDDSYVYMTDFDLQQARNKVYYIKIKNHMFERSDTELN